MNARILLATLAALPCFAFAADVTGKASSDIGGEKREAELKDGKVDGDKLSFV
jgi:hypothetical protein